MPQTCSVPRLGIGQTEMLNVEIEPGMGILRPKVVTYVDRGEVCTWRPQAIPVG
jgi:hypothetical protein